MTDPRRFPPAAQKLNPTGVAAIPPAASAPPEPPPPPSGDPTKVPWSAIRAIVRRWDGWDLYNHDDVTGRHGNTDSALLREFADRISRLRPPGSEDQRDQFADEIAHLAAQYVPPADVDQLAATLRATIADLDGHIARRAGEIAAPYIEAGASHGVEVRREMEQAERRHADLTAEFRRRIAALERQVDGQRERAEKAEALLVQAEAYVRELQDNPTAN